MSGPELPSLKVLVTKWIKNIEIYGSPFICPAFDKEDIIITPRQHDPGIETAMRNWNEKNKTVSTGPRKIKFVIVGSRYRDGYPGFLGSVREGMPIELVHNPMNPYDQYAVEVHIDGMWVGFLPQTGSACLDCGEPWGWTANLPVGCVRCGSENQGKGGLAFMLVKQDLLKDAKAFVTEIYDADLHQPIHGELWLP